MNNKLKSNWTNVHLDLLKTTFNLRQFGFASSWTSLTSWFGRPKKLHLACWAFLLLWGGWEDLVKLEYVFWTVSMLMEPICIFTRTLVTTKRFVCAESEHSSSLYTSPCSLLTGTVYSVHYPASSAQCTAYSVQFTVYSLQPTVYSTQFTVYSLQHTVYSTQFTVYSLQRT